MDIYSVMAWFSSLTEEEKRLFATTIGQLAHSGSPSGPAPRPSQEPFTNANPNYGGEYVGGMGADPRSYHPSNRGFRPPYGNPYYGGGATNPYEHHPYGQQPGHHWPPSSYLTHYPYGSPNRDIALDYAVVYDRLTGLCMALSERDYKELVDWAVSMGVEDGDTHLRASGLVWVDLDVVNCPPTHHPVVIASEDDAEMVVRVVAICQLQAAMTTDNPLETLANCGQIENYTLKDGDHLIVPITKELSPHLYAAELSRIRSAYSDDKRNDAAVDMGASVSEEIRALADALMDQEANKRPTSK